jgi:signal transduction histidine kinase
MVELAQALWEQMSADIGANTLPEVQTACQSLLNGELGPLSDAQREDLESVQRSLDKLIRRVEGESINWADDGEAAHALRGPLNSTIGFSRLLLKGVDGPVTDKQSLALETVYTASRRLLVLFNLLIDALLMDADEIETEIRPTSPYPLLQEIASAGSALATGRGFIFEAEIAATTQDFVVKSDANRLKATLSALLAASVKLKDNGRVAFRARPESDQLSIRIENQGCRLPAPLLSDLSALLTGRADLSLPYDAHLRIGLAWHLLRRMGGRLEIEESEGTAIFAVTLPRA